MHCKTKHFDGEVELVWTKFMDTAQTCLLLMGPEGPEFKATTTVAADLEPGEVAVKDYSENEGMFRWMLESGIITDTGKVVSQGFVGIPIGKLTPKYAKDAGVKCPA